jgi:hypothetical protein
MADAPSLPVPRGPISELLIGALAAPAGIGDLGVVPLSAADPLTDDDLHLALYCLYELHYRGFAGVDPLWEWNPSALELRARLEARFERRLRDAVGRSAPGTDVRAALLAEATGDGPSLSSWMEQHGTLDTMREFCVHRSLYQLKEADPHTWAIPRLAGRPKAALVTIQADEYGGGHEPSMHATLFADTLAVLGLDARYGAYLDVVPGETLATVNLVSMFGLHRRWRAALVGHLALFEMTSRGPMGRYSRALARLGVPAEGRRFYDIHVEADAVHEVLALDELVATFVEDEPAAAADVVFGAKALSIVEGAFARMLLDAWAHARTSLHRPLACAA